jgi:hypothetical protein
MLDTLDQAMTLELRVGADNARRIDHGYSRVVVWSEAPGDWSGSVQIEIATPRSREAGVWLRPDDLRFTANRVASIVGDFHVRAIATGTVPNDLTIEFVR